MTPSGLYFLLRIVDGRRVFWRCREGERAGWYATAQAFDGPALARTIDALTCGGFCPDGGFDVRPLMLPE